LPNEYSREWYETFLDPIPSGATGIEVSFVGRQLPVDDFRFVLDLCCGPGRHAAEFAGRGYRILGVDMNEHVVRRARANCPEASFESRDMRDLASLAGPFDAVVNLWHSFGYFDDETNVEILRQVWVLLRPGGRAIFDIYNRDHFVGLPPEELAERGGRQIRTQRSWNGSRHRVSLEYDGAPGDDFEWRLYSPEEFRAACSSVGLESLVECAWFDESKPPSAEHARMQFVVARAV
jgi:SAM-dependent methyltransferase